MRKLKKIALLLTIISSVFLTSCIHFVEEHYIEADGSGSISYSIDLSNLVTFFEGEDLKEFLGGISEKLGTDFNTKDNDIIYESPVAEEELQDEDDDTPVSLDTSINLLGILNSDTSFNINDIDAKYHDILKDINLNLNADENDKKLDFGVKFDYDNTDEIDLLNTFFTEELKNVKNNKTEDLDLKDLGLEDENLFGGLLDNKKGKLYKMDITNKSYSKKLLLTGKKLKEYKNNMEQDNEELLNLLSTMFGGATYKQIIHTPGKIKKCSNPRAKISADKKTVILRSSLLDALEDPQVQELDIKFKSK